jgi:hypothetical protein
MIPTGEAPITRGGLPPLGGGSLAVYRVLWIVLAAAAVGTLTFSIIHPTTRPLIIGLRLLKAVIVLAVATILFRRRQQDAVAALLTLSLLLWTITSSFDFASAMTSVPAVLDRFRFMLFTIALVLFPSGEWRPRWTRVIAIVTVGVFAIGAAEAVGWLPTHSFLLLAIPCVIAAIATLVDRFRSASTEVERLQLKWVALGLVSGIGCILLARAGFVLATRTAVPVAAPVVLEALFQIGIVLVSLGFLVSLLRYRLFDAETAVSRSAAYGGLTLALLATFAGTEAVIETWGQNYFGMGIGNVAAAIAAAIAAVLLTPLHHRISQWAEQHFQRDLVLLKRELPEILEDLAIAATPPQLAAAVLPRINAAVHATRSALVDPAGAIIAAEGVQLPDVQRWSAENFRTAAALEECVRGDLLFPIRLQLACPVSGTVGWFLLGPRPDGSLYGKEDIGAVNSLRPAVRRALVGATARETSLRAQGRQIQALRRDIAGLRNSLGGARPRKA